MTNPVIVGITGASGSVMARSMVDALLRRDIPTVALCSNAGRMVWQEEIGEAEGGGFHSASRRRPT